MTTYQNMTTANHCNCWLQEGIHQQSTAHGREKKQKSMRHLEREKKNRKKQSTAE